MTGDLELRIAREGETSLERRVFSQPFVLVGSHPSNDFCVRDDAVSKRHAYLQVIQGALFCFDLGSRAGLRWGQTPEPYGWLAPGRCLHIGPYRLWLSDSAATLGSHSERRDLSNPLRERLPPNQSPFRSLIELQQGNGRTAFVNSTHFLTMIGRSSSCKMQFDHPSVSWFHCSLLNTANGMWILDLLSREGTQINGKRCRWAQLKEGEEVRVGKFVLRLRFEPPAASSGHEVLALKPRPSSDHQDVIAQDRKPLPANMGQHLTPLHRGTHANPATSLPESYPNSLIVSASTPESVRSDSTLAPMRAEQSLLLPVIEQFNLMQQQMFDQFHQSMMMLVQMFGAMHRAQMDLIRDELDQLRQLTEDLHTLQAELRKKSPEVNAAQVARPAILDQLPPDKEKQATKSEGAKQGVGGPPAPREPSASVAPPALSGNPGEARAPQGAPGEDIHAWLYRRINEIQQERQTRWQRLLGFIVGK
jgi:pSer/pThr/pTyr-binding forkhead associated (FHA) protein